MKKINNITPKQLVGAVCEYLAIDYSEVMTGRLHAHKTIEICSLLLFAYCNKATTAQKGYALNLDEVDLSRFRSQCLRRMKESQKFENDVAEIKDFFRHEYGLKDLDAVNYKAIANVEFCEKLQANLVVNMAGKQLYISRKKVAGNVA